MIFEYKIKNNDFQIIENEDEFCSLEPFVIAMNENAVIGRTRAKKLLADIRIPPYVKNILIDTKHNTVISSSFFLQLILQLHAEEKNIDSISIDAKFSSIFHTEFKRAIYRFKKETFDLAYLLK